MARYNEWLTPEEKQEFLATADTILGDAGAGEVPGMLPGTWRSADQRWPNVLTLRSKAACIYNGLPYIVDTGVNMQSIYYFCGGYIAFGANIQIHSPANVSQVRDGTPRMMWTGTTQEQWLKMPRVEAYLGNNWYELPAGEEGRLAGITRTMGPQWALAKSIVRQMIGFAAVNSKGLVTFWDRAAMRNSGHMNLVGLAAMLFSGKTLPWADMTLINDRITATNIQEFRGVGFWDGGVTVKSVEKGAAIRNPNSGNDVRQFTIYLGSTERIPLPMYPLLGQCIARQAGLPAPTGTSMFFNTGVSGPGDGYGWHTGDNY